MQYAKFKIKNFRGIRDLLIDLERNPQASVFTVVGLNESGKTTVLEAINQMGREPIKLSAHDPSNHTQNSSEYDSFIPVTERYNFNGAISLATSLRFSVGDIEKLKVFLRDKLGVVPEEQLADMLTIEREINYKNSNFVSLSNTWNIDPLVRKVRGKKIDFLSALLGHESWLKFVNYIDEAMLPQILYFRSEVFDFPNKIVIWAKPVNEKKDAQTRQLVSINGFYRQVVEDILHAIDSTLSITSHIIDRKKSAQEKDGQHLAALLHKISSHVTRTVMEQWEKIFQRKLSDKRIVASCDLDEDGSIYLQFKIHDGSQLFDITDRSAGFRWFFSFIVLTSYRSKKMDSALFLYDEPASNLHSAAQRQLLDCFRTMSTHFKAVYTTHSHYLINPEWLDATFVAQNLGVTPDDLLSADFDSTQTDILLTPYRKFVSENPSQISYFQPVLDVLQYAPSRLEPVKPAVLVEGKSDYYGLSYLLSVCLSKTLAYDLIPCTGSGTVDQLIALYSGWGKSFVVLLDSDKAGLSEKKRYVEKFGSLVRERVKTYSDVNPIWTGFALEKVVGENDFSLIQQTVFPSTEVDKKLFNLAMQELLIKRASLAVSQTTLNNLELIDTFLNACTARLPN